MTFRGKDYVLLDGQITDNFGVYVKDRPEVPTAEQVVEYVDIKGRDGSLTKKYGYKDVEYPITFHMYEDGEGGFLPSYRVVKSKILNAKTLQFADDMAVCHKVKAVRIDNAYNPTKEFGRIPVIFTLDPFMYEVDNEVQTVTARTTIVNDGHESHPIITAHCSGTGKIYVNEQEITVRDVNGTITIDSEMQNAYRKTSAITENMNSHMIGEFPVLKHGDNVIDFSGDVNSLTINPRWRWV